MAKLCEAYEACKPCRECEPCGRCISSRRGQAAMEFLTTYGWVFLVVLVTIGAFVYFGGFSPSKNLPDKCTFGNIFICTDFQYSSTPTPGMVSFTVKQNAGDSLFIKNVVVTTSEFGNNLPCTVSGTLLTGGNEVKLDSYSKAVISCPLAGGSIAIDTLKGQKNRAELRISYRPLRSTFIKEESGELYGTIQ